MGHIYATQTLDYENEQHRKGFNFKVQVSDEVSLFGGLYIYICSL